MPTNRLGVNKTLFLEGAKGLGADLEFDLLAIDDDGFGLQVWLPNFLGVALRKADIVAVLLSFAGDITFLHRVIPYELTQLLTLPYALTDVNDAIING